MIKFSSNKKTNAILTSIYEELQELGVEEIKRYKKEFPFEIDYNLFSYGNLTIYTWDIMKAYEKAGYKVNFEKDGNKFVEAYKRQVGYIATKYFK